MNNRELERAKPVRGQSKMTRKVFALGLILAVAFVLYAQGDKSVKLSGYLIDNACSAGHAKDAGFAERAKKHKTTCALMTSCEGSGYAVYADGKLYKLDDTGNKGAAGILKDTETKEGVMVAVEGTVEGETVHVTKITEVKVATE
jgi:hypothetical protein